MADIRDDYLKGLNAADEIIAELQKALRITHDRVKRARVLFDKCAEDFAKEFPPRTIQDEIRAQAKIDQENLHAGNPHQIVPGNSHLDRVMASGMSGSINYGYRRPYGGQGKANRGHVVTSRKLPSDR